MDRHAGLKKVLPVLLAAAALAVLAAVFFYSQRPRPIAQVLDSMDLRLDAAHPAPVQFAAAGEGYHEVPVSQAQFLQALSASAPVTPAGAAPSFNASEFFLLQADACLIYLGPGGEIIFSPGGEPGRQWRDARHTAYDTLYQLAFGAPRHPL